MSCAVTELRTPDIACRLERWIEQRTSGRVCDVSVEMVGGRVIVHGHAGSHYARQLALAGVMEALEPPQFDQVDLDIEVGGRS